MTSTVFPNDEPGAEMAVDTSSVMAALLNEPDGPAYKMALARNVLFMSAATRVELEVACRRRRGPDGLRQLEEFLSRLDLTIVPVDEEQARIACEAAHRFGQGLGEPPAVLNFGDLFAYALARARNLPLLNKGDDFTQTDIRPALPAGAPL